MRLDSVDIQLSRGDGCELKISLGRCNSGALKSPISRALNSPSAEACNGIVEDIFISYNRSF
jgi:hypothetical protein